MKNVPFAVLLAIMIMSVTGCTSYVFVHGPRPQNYSSQQGVEMGTVHTCTARQAEYDVPDYPGYYIRPIKGGRITQGLHDRNAVDIGTPVGTPVLAAASGEVIDSGLNGGYGGYIKIHHDNDTETVYGHLSEICVDDGQMVVQGQVIGHSGNTGKSTGPHLHFEVRGAENPLR